MRNVNCMARVYKSQTSLDTHGNLQTLLFRYMMLLPRYGAIVTRRTLQLTMLENGFPAVKLFSPVADQLSFSEIHDTVRCTLATLYL